MTELDSVLKTMLGKEIDIVIVHHVEGRHLRTTGILKRFDEHIIELEIEYKDHWFNRKRKGLYVVNRKASSILSLFSWKVEK